MSEPRPIAATAQAMRVLELRQQVTSHNLANSSTPSFRADRVFTRAGAENEGPIATGGRTTTAGPVTPTGRPLDLAIEGDGFLVVRTPDGERMTRDGSLQLDAAMRLVDGSGNPVLGEKGEIVLPAGDVTFGPRGRLHVDGVEIDALRIERLDPTLPPMEAEGKGLFRPPEGAERLRADEIRIHQGAIEGSNVEPVLAMTEMIEIQRSYATLQRSMHVIDGVLDRLTNTVGRVS